MTYWLNKDNKTRRLLCCQRTIIGVDVCSSRHNFQATEKMEKFNATATASKLNGFAKLGAVFQTQLILRRKINKVGGRTDGRTDGLTNTARLLRDDYLTDRQTDRQTDTPSLNCFHKFVQAA